MGFVVQTPIQVLSSNVRSRPYKGTLSAGPPDTGG